MAGIGKTLDSRISWWRSVSWTNKTESELLESMKRARFRGVEIAVVDREAEPPYFER